MGDDCSCPNQLGTPIVGGGGGGGSGTQTLSQAGNIVSLSPGGGSVDISVTTSVASSAQKTTAMTYDGGLLSTTFDGLLFAGQTEIGKPIEPTLLTVNGSMDVVVAPMGAVTLQNLGSVLTPTGLNTVYIDPVTGALGQGANSGGWVGTATSDLNMAGYNINTASAVGIKGVTGLLEFKNGAGVSKGSLAYNEADGDIHLFAEDKLDLTANIAVDITATNGDITLATNTTDIYVNSARGLSMTGAVTGVGITAGGGNVSATANAGNVTLTANQDAFGSGGDLNFTTNLGASITSQSGNIALSASAGSVNLDATSELLLKIGGATQARLAGGGNVGVGGSGSDGSVFLLKNDDSVYGALNYNGANDTLNVDNGGSGISVGSNYVKMTPATGVVMIEGDNTLSKTPALNFNDLGGGYNINLQYGDLGAGRPTLTAQYAHQLGTNLGASQGFTIGTDQFGTNTNCAFGVGGVIPTRFSYSEPALATDYIELSPTTGISLTTSANPINITADGGSTISLLSVAGDIDLTASVGDVIVSAGGGEHLRVSPTSVSITDVPLGLNAQNITGVKNVRYEHSYSTTGVTLTANSAAIQTLNGTGLTATLPLVDATNVGRQFIITNVSLVGLTVASSGSQLIYYNVGSASATTRTLGPGHSQILTAIRTGVSTYGWSMV